VCEDLADRAFGRFEDFQKKNPGFAVTAGTVVGISAAYYAAKVKKTSVVKSTRFFNGPVSKTRSPLRLVPV
jgi:hypothetical protein